MRGFTTATVAEDPYELKVKTDLIARVARVPVPSLVSAANSLGAKGELTKKEQREKITLTQQIAARIQSLDRSTKEGSADAATLETALQSLGSWIGHAEKSLVAFIKGQANAARDREARANAETVRSMQLLPRTVPMVDLSDTTVAGYVAFEVAKLLAAGDRKRVVYTKNEFFICDPRQRVAAHRRYHYCVRRARFQRLGKHHAIR